MFLRLILVLERLQQEKFRTYIDDRLAGETDPVRRDMLTAAKYNPKQAAYLLGQETPAQKQARAVDIAKLEGQLRMDAVNAKGEIDLEIAEMRTTGLTATQRRDLSAANSWYDSKSAKEQGEIGTEDYWTIDKTAYHKFLPLLWGPGGRLSGQPIPTLTGGGGEDIDLTNENLATPGKPSGPVSQSSGHFGENVQALTGLPLNDAMEWVAEGYEQATSKYDKKFWELQMLRIKQLMEGDAAAGAAPTTDSVMENLGLGREPAPVAGKESQRGGVNGAGLDSPQEGRSPTARPGMDIDREIYGFGRPGLLEGAKMPPRKPSAAERQREYLAEKARRSKIIDDRLRDENTTTY